MSFSRRTLFKASAATAVLGGAPYVARAQTAKFTMPRRGYPANLGLSTGIARGIDYRRDIPWISIGFL
jgi:hypothetical protein